MGRAVLSHNRAMGRLDGTGGCPGFVREWQSGKVFDHDSPHACRTPVVVAAGPGGGFRAGGIGVCLCCRGRPRAGGSCVARLRSSCGRFESGGASSIAVHTARCLRWPVLFLLRALLERRVFHALGACPVASGANAELVATAFARSHHVARPTSAFFLPLISGCCCAA